MHNRQQFLQRQVSILKMAESLLLESVDGDLTLDDLASGLEIAKGTLYKHFDSKDELYLRLLIAYEEKLHNSIQFDDGAGATLARMVLYPLLNPREAMLYHWLEERLSASNINKRNLFDELYQVRRARMNALSGVVRAYLKELNSPMNADEYLPTLWALGQGGSLLLNSSFYQRYLGSREQKILAWLTQALSLPKNVQLAYDLPLGDMLLPVVPAKTGQASEIKDDPKDEFRNFVKLTPPAL